MAVRLDRETKQYLLIGVVGLVFISQIRGLFGPSKDTRNLDGESQSTTSPWNPNFWKQAPAGVNPTILTDTAVDSFIRTIDLSVSPWIDNFNSVMGIFKQLHTQSQVSYLVDKWNQRKHSDLLTWLRGSIWPIDAFSDDEVNQLVTYVSKLPKYKI